MPNPRPDGTHQIHLRHGGPFQRLHKDGDEWKTTDTFGRDGLPLVAKVADLDRAWICK